MYLLLTVLRSQCWFLNKIMKICHVIKLLLPFSDSFKGYFIAACTSAHQTQDCLVCSIPASPLHGWQRCWPCVAFTERRKLYILSSPRSCNGVTHRQHICREPSSENTDLPVLQWPGLWIEGGEATAAPVVRAVWRAPAATGTSPSPTRAAGSRPPASSPASLDRCVVSAGTATGFRGRHHVRVSVTLGPFLCNVLARSHSKSRLLNHFAKDNNDEVRASGRHFPGVITVLGRRICMERVY